MTAAGSASVEIGGRSVRLTSLERVIWPSVGFTKAHMADYYVAIAPVLLSYLGDRAVTLMRAPSGVDGKQWFQTRCPHPPPWVRTASVGSSTRPGEVYDYCVIDDAASLLWAVNMGAVEFHPLSSTTRDAARATWMVFDLDPGPPADLATCCRAAVEIRKRLLAEGLRPRPKTSGSVGLHLFCPFDDSFEAAGSFARSLARDLARSHPDLITDRSTHADRAGKVMIDWRQNSPLRSTVAPYSLRAQALPWVSTPLRWDEVEAATEGRPRSLMFLPDAVLARVEALGDLFATSE